MFNSYKEFNRALSDYVLHREFNGKTSENRKLLDDLKEYVVNDTVSKTNLVEAVVRYLWDETVELALYFDEGFRKFEEQVSFAERVVEKQTASF
ncbi:MAG: hypothetical protein EOM04_09175 [Clostridia bacterium]|nr:hypothetical protein [Clostridia bacterium]